ALTRQPHTLSLFPYTTLFRSAAMHLPAQQHGYAGQRIESAPCDAVAGNPAAPPFAIPPAVALAIVPSLAQSTLDPFALAGLGLAAASQAPAWRGVQRDVHSPPSVCRRPQADRGACPDLTGEGFIT